MKKGATETYFSFAGCWRLGSLHKSRCVRHKTALVAQPSRICASERGGRNDSESTDPTTRRPATRTRQRGGRPGGKRRRNDRQRGDSPRSERPTNNPRPDDPPPNNPGPNDLRPDEPDVLKNGLPMAGIKCSGLTFFVYRPSRRLFSFSHVRRSGCSRNHDQTPRQPLRSNWQSVQRRLARQLFAT